MKAVLNAKSLKMIGGGIIVAGAFAILFPDMLTYFGGIAKLLLMIVVAVLSAAFVTRAFYKLKAAKPAVEPSSQPAVVLPTTKADTTSDT